MANTTLAIFEPALYIILTIATIVVSYGSKRSLASLSRPTTTIDREVSNQPGVTMKMAIILPVAGSAMLLLLFFFLDLLFWFYLILISLYGWFAVGYVLHPSCLWLIRKYAGRRGIASRFTTIPNDSDWDPDIDTSENVNTGTGATGLNDVENENEGRSGIRRESLFARIVKWPDTTWSGVICGTIGLAIVVAWILTGNWILHDILAISMTIMMLSFVRVTSIKLSSVLLTLFFIYDIFWVFFSSSIFGESVMVSVAKKISLPVYIVFPRLLLGGFSLLGLGDMVLPGLLICFTARYDAAVASARPQVQTSISASYPRCFFGCGSFKLTYFRMTLMGYSFALLCASLVATIFESGQPALLYLVPFTLLPVIIRAHLSGELRVLWNGVGMGGEGEGGGETEGRNSISSVRSAHSDANADDDGVELVVSAK